MATRRGPRFKECRWVGVNAIGNPKAMKRVSTHGNLRRTKPTEYRVQMLEKQKLKIYYNIFEKQLVRYYEEALRSSEQTGTALLRLLESRLDNLVYRIGFANSIRMARQLVSHGHIIVNSKRIDIPSYQVKPGDVIALHESSRKVEVFCNNFRDFGGFSVPYIERNTEELSAKFTRLPEREEIPVEVNDRQIIEFYSR